MTARVALAVALPAVPFVAALAGLLLPLPARRVAAVLGVGSTGVALLAAIALAASSSAQGTEAAVRVVDFGGIAVSAGVRVDVVAALVAVAVGVVACAVQVYSVAYLADDERYVPYAAQVSLFTAAMLLVVVASDLVQLLVGWEVMGICSYLLIGHDRTLPQAPAAAVKAFLVTRVGDVAFWLGIVVLGVSVGSFGIADVTAAAAAGRIDATTVTAAAVLLLGGVAGKSAQFPLHTWLPDAMAGPTPISALIHAATMVAAGVYVVGRLFPLYAASPVALTVLAATAAVTMLLGALAAAGQDDVKRVLAWSTVSQIAYMAGALAVGSVAASTFHLLSHAAFKALLFLGAGAVIHVVGANVFSAMGGLRRGMPVTFATMTVGLAALAGVPPLAGFFSKESVLGAAWEATHGHAGVPRVAAFLVFGSAIVTVAVTGWYVTRLWLRTFFGPAPGGVAAHDPPAAMRWPLVALAVPTVVLGVVVAWWPGTGSRPASGWFTHQPAAGWTAYLPPADTALAAVALLLTALGGVGAWLRWRRDVVARPATPWRPAPAVLARAFYLDDVQDAVVVRPARALARLVRRGDESMVDGAVEGTGARALGLGRWLANVHSGLPRYAAGVLAGAAVIALAAAVTGVFT